MENRETSTPNRSTIDDEYVSHTHHQFERHTRNNDTTYDGIRLDKNFIQHGLCDKEHSIRPNDILKEMLIKALKLAVDDILTKKICTYEEISSVSNYDHTNVPMFLPREDYINIKRKLMNTRFTRVGNSKNINRLMLSIETLEGEITTVTVDGIVFNFDTHMICGSALVSHKLVEYYQSIDPSPEPFRNIKRRATYNRYKKTQYSIFEFVWNIPTEHFTDRFESKFRPRLNGKSVRDVMLGNEKHVRTSEDSCSMSSTKNTDQVSIFDDLLNVSKVYPIDKVMVANALKSLIVSDSLYEFIRADIIRTSRDYLENKHVLVVEVSEIQLRVDQTFMIRSDKLTGFCVRNIDIFRALIEKLSEREADKRDSDGSRIRRTTFTFRLDTTAPNNLFTSKYVTCKISDVLLSVDVMEYINKFYENMFLFNKGITNINMKRHKYRNDEGMFEFSVDLVFSFTPLENEEDGKQQFDIENVTNGITTVKL